MTDGALVFPADPNRAIIRSAPPPGLRIEEHREPLPSVYFGVRIDAAVNLLEAREYEALERTERLRKALDEQRTYINAVLDPSLRLALDLRTRVRPQERPPIQIALLGRVWGDDDRVALTARAGTLQRQLLATLPRHLTGSPIDDSDELLQWLSPFGSATAVDAAMVTRREVTAVPRRPDAKVAYYFSVVPFGWSETDWTSVYAALSSSPVAVVLSVALLPVDLPASFTLRLEHMATFYGRLAEGGPTPGRPVPRRTADPAGRLRGRRRARLARLRPALFRPRVRHPHRDRRRGCAPGGARRSRRGSNRVRRRQGATEPSRGRSLRGGVRDPSRP